MMMPKPTRLTKIVRKMMRRGRVTGCQYSSFILFRPRALVVVNRRVVEVRDAPAGLVDQSGDAGHLVELDLRDFVRVHVVIGMEPGEEEDDRNALRGVAVMIAAEIQLLRIAGIVEFVTERQRPGKRCVGRACGGVELGADAVGSDEVNGL